MAFACPVKRKKGPAPGFQVDLEGKDSSFKETFLETPMTLLL